MTSSRRTRRPVLGYWVPLVATVSIATVGLVTWAMHAHGNSEDGYDSDSSVSSSSDAGSGQEQKQKEKRKRAAKLRAAGGAKGKEPAGESAGDGATRRSFDPNYDPTAFGSDDGDESHQIRLIDKDDHDADRTTTPFQTVKNTLAPVGQAFSSVFNTVAQDTRQWLEEFQKSQSEHGSEPDLSRSGSVPAPADGPSTKAAASRADERSPQTDIILVIDADAAPLLSHIRSVPENINLIILMHTPHGSDPTAAAAAAAAARAGAGDISSASSESAVIIPSTGASFASSSGVGAFSSLMSPRPEEVEAVLARAAALLPATAPDNLIRFASPDGWLQIARHIRPKVVYLPMRLGLAPDPKLVAFPPLPQPGQEDGPGSAVRRQYMAQNLKGFTDFVVLLRAEDEEFPVEPLERFVSVVDEERITDEPAFKSDI